MNPERIVHRWSVCYAVNANGVDASLEAIACSVEQLSLLVLSSVHMICHLHRKNFRFILKVNTLKLEIIDSLTALFSIKLFRVN